MSEKVVGAKVRIINHKAVSCGKTGVIQEVDLSHYEGRHCRPLRVQLDENKGFSAARNYWWDYDELVVN